MERLSDDEELIMNCHRRKREVRHGLSRMRIMIRKKKESRKRKEKKEKKRKENWEHEASIRG